VTDEAVAVKFSVVAPDGTVTEAGKETELLLLDSATDIPPEPAAALRVTAHVSETAPVSELLVQLRPLSVALAVEFFPCPLSFTCVEFPCDASLVRVNVPDEVAVEEGVYATCRVVEWLGSRVRGKLVFPTSVKPCPEIVALVSVNVVELVFVIWTCCVPVSPITTPPKLTVVGLGTMGEAVPELTWGAPQPATTIRSELNARSSQALWSATTRLKVFLMPGLYGREGSKSTPQIEVPMHPGEEKNRGILTSKSHPFLEFM
jgi:hypothetical protein